MYGHKGIGLRVGEDEAHGVLSYQLLISEPIVYDTSLGRRPVDCAVGLHGTIQRAKTWYSLGLSQELDATNQAIGSAMTLYPLSYLCRYRVAQCYIIREIISMGIGDKRIPMECVTPHNGVDTNGIGTHAVTE